MMVAGLLDEESYRLQHRKALFMVKEATRRSSEGCRRMLTNRLALWCLVP